MNDSLPQHEVSFLNEEFPTLALEAGAPLTDHLTIQNSCVLFGCRTGICGTCLVEVEVLGGGILPAPSPDEKDTLEVYAPGNARARLACQLNVTSNLLLRRCRG